MGFLKSNMLKVVEWVDNTPGTLVHKFESSDRYAIMKGSELIVRPAQAAIFVYRGAIEDVFTEGNWKLDEGATPLLTQAANWKYAWENPKQIDVYFVNLKQFTGLKWGTTNPVMLPDKDFGMIRVMGHGEFAFHVCKPQLFMREYFGTLKSCTTEQIKEYLKSIILMELTDLMGECEIPALQLAANYRELGDTTRDKACEKFGKLGLAVDEVLIKNLKLPESVEKAMDQRTALGVIGDKMGAYAQYESVQAMRDAAKNPGAGGAFAAMGVGLGAGARVGAGFAAGIDAATAPAKKTEKCLKCGAEMAEGAKFCPECGEKNLGVGKTACVKCGAAVDLNAKFCPDCGAAMTAVCPKCGASLKAKAKFCPECGAKIK